MSGFAASTGEPDGPPTLPPFGLADGIASLATAFAVMSALHQRQATGRGQVVDVAIVEPIMALLGPQISRWDQLHTLQERLGNRSSNNAPRNTYQTSDGHWVAISTSSQSIAERVLRLVGRADLVAEPWFAAGRTRAEHSDVLDDAVGGWIAAAYAGRGHRRVRTRRGRRGAGLHRARTSPRIRTSRRSGTIRRVPDDDLGELAMQGPLFRMADGDAPTRFAGRSPGVDTTAVLRELGYTDDEVAALVADGAAGAPEDRS